MVKLYVRNPVYSYFSYISFEINAFTNIDDSYFFELYFNERFDLLINMKKDSYSNDKLI